MSGDIDLVNEALERHLTSYLSREARASIEAEFGADVAEQVKAVYDGALQCPVDWRTQTMDDALAVLSDWLANNCPWLSDGARRKIVGAFVYEWK